jgi:hypothetical protein
MYRQRPARAVLFAIAPVAFSCLLLGCGGETTYHLSGKVTFKGQPIPSGKIYFIPDTTKGNKGPTGYADIKDGNYDTAAKGGSGCVGGAMIIKIEGIDPAGKPDKVDKSEETTGKPLFPPYQTTVEIPKQKGTKDFDVPADAGKGGAPKVDPNAP